jgi:hypothetical protein
MRKRFGAQTRSRDYALWWKQLDAPADTVIFSTRGGAFHEHGNGFVQILRESSEKQGQAVFFFANDAHFPELLIDSVKESRVTDKCECCLADLFGCALQWVLTSVETI